VRSEVEHLPPSQPETSARDWAFVFYQCYRRSLANASGYDNSLCFAPLISPILEDRNFKRCELMRISNWLLIARDLRFQNGMRGEGFGKLFSVAGQP
jgi:hypothetical protein